MVPRRWLFLFFLVMLISGIGAYPSKEGNLPAMTPTIESNSSTQSASTPAASPTVLPTRVVVSTLPQTNGLILGGIVLVLIIIGGTLSAIRQKPNH
jgi:glucose uptake protein GlcU